MCISDRSDPYVCFKDAEIALLVGSRPRTADMQRADLLAANAQIFVEQGKAMNEVADRNIKVLVVGNPCNTNAYIARRCAPDLSLIHILFFTAPLFGPLTTLTAT